MAGRWGEWVTPSGRLELEPLFPNRAFAPDSECPHAGLIPAGSILCCMVCHQSGVDDHPAFARDPRTDPKPEPKVETPAEPEPTRAEKAGKKTSGKMAKRRKAKKLAEAA